MKKRLFVLVTVVNESEKTLCDALPVPHIQFTSITIFLLFFLSFLHSRTYNNNTNKLMVFALFFFLYMIPLDIKLFANKF